MNLTTLNSLLYVHDDIKIKLSGLIVFIAFCLILINKVANFCQ